MSEANFNLMSWASNSPKLQATIHKEKVADANLLVNLLGLQWGISTDQISFIPKRIDSIAHSVIIKRRILQYSFRIFDPFDILSPASIHAKLFIQQLWQRNINWD